jgi:hypothetical protein
MYETWKQSVLGPPPKFLTEVDGITNPYGIECVTVDWSWANYLWPTIPIQDTISTGNAATLFANANPQYFEKIQNTGGANVNVTPQQGDIAVFGATPAAGVSNTYVNPDGHTGVVDSWSNIGVMLVEQDGSAQSLPVHIKYVPYAYDPLIGFLRPIIEEINMKPTVNQIMLAYQLALNTNPTQEQITAQLGQPDLSHVLSSLAEDSQKAWAAANGEGTVLAPGKYVVNG